ncbi:MAG: N-6 DNA methylase [Deltaproteobacteria bacterium]|nr:N-6 DNA methylase [Deltaproteobacteria bacterium]
MTIVSTYLKNIEKSLATGNATEHSYRPALKEFIESLAEDIEATNEPKREQCGAPDFIITKGKTPIGYIETKDIGKPLDIIERDEQLMRYRKRLGNLILTDYLEFRWYVQGEHRLTARLAKVDLSGKIKAVKDSDQQIVDLLTEFLRNRMQMVSNPKELAVRMAALAQLIRDTIRQAFTDEDGGGELHKQMEGFRRVLLHDLTQEQFADMYAQTICYGLFAARCNVRIKPGVHFIREHAAFDLPKTNPFLRKMFSHIAGPDLDDRIAWIVDDLTNLLDHTDMEGILKDFGKRTRQEDPLIHFYETFLAAYDPKMRQTRGVYYTPEPVVSYIVRSVDHILKTDFNLPTGLADAGKITISNPVTGKAQEIHRVLILDPAAGTGTFLHGVIDQIYDQIQRSGQKGAWGGEKGYVAQHLLPRIFGFELLMAPYAVAHMKLGLQLTEFGYDFSANERLHVYLTNTLEEAYKISDMPLFTKWLVEEANAAGVVKQEAPVMVILGNPPYSYESVNTGEWITNLIQDYYSVDGQPLGERNPKGLQDDYVKFIRFAQWRIEKTGYGVMALITNHGYLDNPTFRGMRRSLMKTFGDIYILDLHGNSKKKERCPDGSKDENVFDIQQGVAIGIFVKKYKPEDLSPRIRHAHLWGIREVYENTPDGRKLSGGKYHWLWENDIQSTTWEPLTPQPPFYLFVPQDTALLPEYERGWKVTDIMSVHSVGIVTSRDHLTVHMTSQEAKEKLHRFISLSPEAARQELDLGEDSRDWQIALAQSDLKQTGLSDSYLIRISYRPFDDRFTFYTGHSRGFHSMPRPAVMNQMLDNNMALLTSRMTKGESFAHVYLTKFPSEKILLSPKTSNNSFHFPLYLYSESGTSLFKTDTPGGRRSNLAPAFIEDFATRLGMTFVPNGKGDRQQTFGPEDIFFYMYAVLHSPTYRSRYAEFLKIDFPRLPLTSNSDLFRALCKIGEDLVALHLMEKQIPLITGYPVAGDSTVETVRYTESSPSLDPSHQGREDNGRQGAGRVWINKSQYFDGVPPEVWNFHIGGYQVCQKWLKDRKGRQLTYDDITHYQRIVATLAETISLMAAIDETINSHGGWPIV